MSKLKRIYVLWFLGAFGVALAGIVNAGTGTFYDASNFGASGSGSGSGGVTGPGSSTDTALARFSGATGTVLQNSTVLLDNTGNMVFPGAKSISLSSTGSMLTIIGTTTGDASPAKIVLDDSGPIMYNYADTYSWKNSANTLQWMVLSPSDLSTSSTITASFPGTGLNSTRLSSSSAGGDSSIAVGPFANAPQIDTIAVGESTNATGQYSAAFMYGATSGGYRSLALGYLSNSGFYDSICIGTSCSVTNDNGISIGAASTASNEDVCVGVFSSCTGPGGTPSTCMGSHCTASNFGNATGYSSTASGGGSSYGRNSSSSSQGAAFGPFATAAASAFSGGDTAAASATDSVSIGHGSTVGAAHTNSVCIGKSCATTAANQFQLGATGTALDMRAYGKFQLTKGLGIWNTTPPATQPVAIPDATGGAVIDVQCRAALNNLLAASRGMGMIAP